MYRMQEILQKLRCWLARPNWQTQLLFLHEVQAFRATATTVNIDHRISEIPEFSVHRNYYPEVLQFELALSKKLELLGFDSHVAMSVRKGEDTGDPSKGVQAAINYLNLLTEIKDKSQSKWIVSGLAVFIALLMLVLLPQMVAGTVESLLDSGLDMKLTWATYVLMYLGSNHSTIPLAITVLSSAGLITYLLRDDLADSMFFRKLFAIPFNYFATKRSLYLLIIWKMYRQSGLPLDKDTEALGSTLGARVYARLSPALTEGDELAHAIHQESHEFSMLLSSPIVALSRLSQKQFEEATNILVKLLINDQKKQAAKLASVLTISGGSIAVVTILLMVFGLIFPVMSINAVI